MRSSPMISCFPVISVPEVPESRYAGCRSIHFPFCCSTHPTASLMHFNEFFVSQADAVM